MPKVSFADSKITNSIFIMFLFGFLMSFMPKENFMLLGIMEGLALICSIFIIIYWKLNVYNIMLVNNINAYIMLMYLGLSCSIPLIRVVKDGYFFWIVLIATIIFVLTTHIFKKQLNIFITNPLKYKKLWKISSTVMMIITFFAIIMWGYTENNDNINTFVVSLSIYLLSLIFWLVSPVLLVRAKEDKLNERRKSM